MKLIISLILILSTLFLSGCNFSLWDECFVFEKEKSITKIGAITTDMMIDNAVLDDGDKQFIEEDLKEQVFIFGIRLKREF